MKNINCLGSLSSCFNKLTVDSEVVYHPHFEYNDFSISSDFIYLKPEFTIDWHTHSIKCIADSFDGIISQHNVYVEGVISSADQFTKKGYNYQTLVSITIETS